MNMPVKQGVTYYGKVGQREVERKVNKIETRSSGTRYVNWIHKKKDGSNGQNSWTEYSKFQAWAKGIYEIEAEV